MGQTAPQAHSVRDTCRGMPLALDLMKLSRPRHWVKNGIILLPVVFARKAAEPDAWLAAGLAALTFILMSSGIYALNDVQDRRADRLHPHKSQRPVASGRVRPSHAISFAICCIAAAIFLAGWQVSTLIIICCYLVLQLAYTYGLKHRPIADVLCIAIGFVLRALMGSAAISVSASSWLLVCAFTLCLFLGFCKRWAETVCLAEEASAWSHRKTLHAYTPEFLVHLVTLSASIATMSYIMYCTSESTVQRFNTHALLLTVPFVLYGIYRFAMISMQGRYSDPVAALLADRPLMATGALWLACVLLILYSPSYIALDLRLAH